MLVERQIFLPLDTAPRRSVLLFSFFSHFVVLALLVIVWRNAAKVHIVPEEYTVVQTISGPASLSFNSAKPKPRQSHASLLHMHKSVRPARAPEPQTTAEGTSAQALRERAKKATAGLMMDIRQRQFLWVLYQQLPTCYSDGGRDSYHPGFRSSSAF